MVVCSVLLLASRIRNHRKRLDSNAAIFGPPERLGLLMAGPLSSSPAGTLVLIADALLCVVSSGQVLKSGGGTHAVR